MEDRSYCTVPFTHYCTADSEYRCHIARLLSELESHRALAASRGSARSTILKRTACYKDLRRSPHYRKAFPISPINSKKVRKGQLITRSMLNSIDRNIHRTCSSTLTHEDAGSQDEVLQLKPLYIAPKTRDESGDLGSSGRSPKEQEVELILSTLKTQSSVEKGSGNCGTHIRPKWQNIDTCVTIFEDVLDLNETPT